MPNGRVSISARAMTRTVTAIAADELRVPARDVSVQLSDVDGLLAVAVAAPIRLAGLGTGTSRGILSSSAAAREGISERTHDLTGSIVGTVAVRITRAVVLAESRVK
jgi:CO/xanthine dehydrogenase Mo-binding subunit